MILQFQSISYKAIKTGVSRGIVKFRPTCISSPEVMTSKCMKRFDACYSTFIPTCLANRINLIQAMKPDPEFDVTMMFSKSDQALLVLEQLWQKLLLLV